MNAAQNHCETCFPDGTRLSQRSFSEQHDALALLRALVAQGKLPMLCRRGELEFRVCCERLAD
ncbi:MAG TPA: hypothetical protein VF801_12900 [Rhodocyclaceae bacterium]